ncbi:MAG: hypothetical protein AB1633_06885 [Elusimicrobiota bacterium]
MKIIFRILYCLMTMSFVFFSACGNATIDGGECAYRKHAFQAVIISVYKTDSSTTQKGNTAICYEGLEIKYFFENHEELYSNIRASSCKELAKDTLLLMINAGHAYPGSLFVSKYGIDSGDVFTGTLSEITEGSCVPCIIEFDSINTFDDFEIDSCR